MEKHTIVDAVDTVLFMPAEGRPAEGKHHMLHCNLFTILLPRVIMAIVVTECENFCKY